MYVYGGIAGLFILVGYLYHRKKKRDAFYKELAMYEEAFHKDQLSKSEFNKAAQILIDRDKTE